MTRAAIMMAQKTANVGLYESWVREHGQALYRLAYRLCGQRDLAEDLTQETFCEAWRSINNLADRTKGKAWLFQILRHRWSHYLRDRSRRIATTANHDAAANAAAIDSVDSLALSDLLSNALGRIDASLRTPLLLVAAEGYTCNETACALKLPLGTVLSRMHRAKAVMRQYLQREELMAAR